MGSPRGVMAVRGVKEVVMEKLKDRGYRIRLGEPPELTALTPMRAEFVRQFAIHGARMRAATAAGYSAKEARKVSGQLLNRKDVQAALAAHFEYRRLRMAIDETTIALMLMDLYTDEEKVTPQVRLGAVKELARMHGVAQEREDRKAAGGSGVDGGGSSKVVEAVLEGVAKHAPGALSGVVDEMNKRVEESKGVE